MLDKIIHGDAYEVIKNIQDKSIDLIITDPPYLIKHQSDLDLSNENDDKLTKRARKMINELSDLNIVDGIVYSILDEFMRVMKKPNIYIWCNKNQILNYLEFFVTKHKCKFDILVWIKTNPIPLCGQNYLPDKEYCLYFRKGANLHADYKRAKTYYITSTNKKDKALYNHPTVKPLEIIENLVLNSSKPNDIIFDPFIGSGTTAIAAHKHNRKYIGIDVNDNCVHTTIQRLKQNDCI